MLEASGQWFVVRLLHCLDPLQDDNRNDSLKTMNTCLVFWWIVVMDVFKPPVENSLNFRHPSGGGEFLSDLDNIVLVFRRGNFLLC